MIYVSDLKKIFLVESSQFDQLIDIHQHINNDEFIAQKTVNITPNKLKNGDIVIVYYELDTCWYRAIVIDKKLNAENQIKLFFVDYGFEEYIKVANIRNISSMDDKVLQETFKINNCDLSFLENVTNDEKYILEKLKELEGKPVIIKILHVYMTGSSSKPTNVENYLPRYLINLYMDKNDEANNEERLFKLLSKPVKTPEPELAQFDDADESTDKILSVLDLKEGLLSNVAHAQEQNQDLRSDMMNEVCY